MRRPLVRPVIAAGLVGALVAACGSSDSTTASSDDLDDDEIEAIIDYVRAEQERQGFER